jgi:hypothetical protein
MSTPKELRAPPVQDFDKYIFTRTVGPGDGLFPVSSTAMLKYSDYATANGINIGFEFKFNEKIYNRFVALSNGAVILREKSDNSTFDIEDYVDATELNEVILDHFTKGGILLCPWFDYLSDANLNPSESNIKGLVAPPPSVDLAIGGTRFLNKVNSQGENCLIIRWRSFADASSGTPSASSIISFETVIYESGKIEFRYSPKLNLGNYLSLPSFEGATVGIFINDRENTDLTHWRFRDFSIGLGHPLDSTRVISKHGGAEYDPTYIDRNAATVLASILNPSWVDKPYNLSIFVSNIDNSYIVTDTEFLRNRVASWPGQDLFGSIMTFEPPKNKRKSLPRKDILIKDSRPSYPQTLRTGDTNRLGKSITMFDDRRSLVYGKKTLVNYPTVLPREYSNTTPGAVERQDLYGDFDILSYTSKTASDSWLDSEPKKHIVPYRDHNRPEQAAASQGAGFYLTGSSIEVFGTGLSQALKSKTQIHLDLPIHHKLQLLETGSAIYYYNKTVKGMYAPQAYGSINDIANIQASIEKETEGYFWPEDTRCFGPIGNVVASGSSAGLQGLNWSSDPEFGLNSDDWISKARKGAIPDVLLKTYIKSAQLNPQYAASKNETFTIPINHPFLLEKAVFEIPMTCGPGWFLDKTTSSTPIGICGTTNDAGISRNVFDFTGPAITVSLFNQIKNGLETYRDLILTGTITSQNDNTKNIAIRQTWSKTGSDINQVWIFEPEGFNSFSDNPSAVIVPDENYFFTGSVNLTTEAGVSNGLVLRYENQGFGGEPELYADQRSFTIKKILSEKELLIFGKPDSNIKSGDAFESKIKSINPFSRSARGNNVSGRSLFGKEYVTFQALKGKVKNPLYVADTFDEFPEAIKNVLDTDINPVFQSYLQYAVPIDQSIPSPYLLKPGDNLIFSLSKNRPSLHTNGFLPIADEPVDLWRQGLRHDVWINTGSIKITLYGSLLREAKEYHDPLNQNLDTVSIHETIGMDPIVDQFQVETSDQYYKSYTDGVMDGTLFSTRASLTVFTSSTGQTSTVTFSPNQRTNVISTVRNFLYPFMSDTLEGYYYIYNLINSYKPKSFLLKELKDFCGIQNNIKLTSFNERYYDSFMPDFASCIRKNEKSIHYLESPNEILKNYYDRKRSHGAIFLNSNSPETEDFEKMNDKRWNFSFPFEYDVPGKSEFPKSILTNVKTSIEDASSIELTENKNIEKMLICFESHDGILNVMCDIDNTSFIKETSDLFAVTSSLSKDDMMKVLYGFGDKNTMESTIEGKIVGHNHQPNFALEYRVISSGKNNFINYQIGPIIRGWKYGVISGTPFFSSAVFNRNRFGHFRDMLEQRLDSKFFIEDITDDGRSANSKISVGSSPVQIKFINIATGDIASPEKTLGSNITSTATSHLPYFDNLFTNRSDDFSQVNQTIVELTV